MLLLQASFLLALICPVSNAMSGVTDLRELSIHIIEMVIEETDVGISWIVRLCALFITLGALFLYTNKRLLSCLLMTMSGGVALATLARGGHAVMHDGLHYYLHLLSDLTHLGAAGAGQVLWLHLLSC